MQDKASRFRVVGRLGGGSHTEIHLCRLQGVEGFEKEVAVKRLTSEYASNPSSVRAFLEEARLVAKLSHRNIVQVFEVGESSEGPYLVMEYVKGVTLGMIAGRAKASGRIHSGHLAKMTAAICDALAYTHSAVDEDGKPLGLGARDVDPANIIVSREGIPKLLDFERVPGRPDRSADVVGVGKTLFELTTGTNPFGKEGRRETPAGPAPRPSEIIAGYPLELERIVLGAVEPDPSKRFPNVQRLCDSLEEFAASPEHRSNPRALVAWLCELFPELAPPPKDPTPPGPVSVAVAPVRLPRDEPTVSARATPPVPLPIRPPSTSRGPYGAPPARVRQPGVGPWRWTALAVLVVAGAVIGKVWFWQSPPAPSVSERSPSTASADREAEAYVTAAEAMAREKRLESALELARKASELRVQDLALNIRLARLKDDLARSLEAQRLERRSAEVALAEPAVAHPRPSHRPIPPNRRRALAHARTSRPAPREDPAPEKEPVARWNEPEAPRGAAPPPRAPAVGALPPAPPPGEGMRPAAAVERQTDPGPKISPPPRSPIPMPSLPRVYLSEDDASLARVCQAVESAVITLAGVSPEFARGVTVPLRRAVRRRSPIYPIAMYYFVVREAGLRHDNYTAAANLAAAQSNGTILVLKDLPGIDRNLPN